MNNDLKDKSTAKIIDNPDYKSLWEIDKENQYKKMKSVQLKGQSKKLSKSSFYNALEKTVYSMSSTRDPILNMLWGSADMMGGAVGGVSKGAYQAVKDKIQETYTTKNKPEYDMEVGAIYQDYYEKMVAIQTIQSVASQFLEGDERKTLNADLNKAAQRASFDLLSAEYVESSGKGETSLNPQSAALAGMFIQKQMGTEQAGKYVKFLPMIDAAIPDDYRMGRNNYDPKWYRSERSPARKALSSVVSQQIESGDVTQSVRTFATKSGIAQSELSASIQRSVDSFVMANVALAEMSSLNKQGSQIDAHKEAQRKLDLGVRNLGIASHEQDYLNAQNGDKSQSVFTGVQNALGSIEAVYRLRGDEKVASQISEMNARFSKAYSAHSPKEISEASTLNARTILFEKAANGIYNNLRRELEQTGRVQIEEEGQGEQSSTSLVPQFPVGGVKGNDTRAKTPLTAEHYERIIDNIDQKLGRNIDNWSKIESPEQVSIEKN